MKSATTSPGLCHPNKKCLPEKPESPTDDRCKNIKCSLLSEARSFMQVNNENKPKEEVEVKEEQSSIKKRKNKK